MKPCEITAKSCETTVKLAAKSLRNLRNHRETTREACEILRETPFKAPGTCPCPVGPHEEGGSGPPLLMGLENLFTLISRAPYFCPSVLQFIVAPRNPRNRREACETAAKSGEINAKPLAKSP